MSRMSRFFKWLFNVKKKAEHTTPLDPDLIKRDDTIRELVRKINAQDAQLSNVAVEKRKEEEESKKHDKENETAKRLNEAKEEIRKKKFDGNFSFLKFYKRFIKDKKFRSKIEIVDREDSNVFGKFGDFFVLTDGNIALVDVNGNLMSYGRTLKEVIFKPGSLGNQIRRGRITLPCDKDYNFIPDIEEQEVPECTYNEVTGKIKWAKVREKPLKQMIIERERIISEDKNYIERIEKTKADLVRRIKSLMRENSILNKSKEIAELESSKATNKMMEYSKASKELQSRIAHLQHVSNLGEELIGKLETINEELMGKVEELGIKSDFQRVLATVQDLIDWASQKVPEPSIVEKTVERTPQQLVRPGERL